MTDLFTVSSAVFQSPTSSVPIVGGHSIAKAQWGPHKRARLAAQWKTGTINVKPTVKLASEVFRVSEQLIRQAIAEVPRCAVPNGTPVMPVNQVESIWWTGLTEPQHDEFVRAHFDSIWASVERLTR